MKMGLRCRKYQLETNIKCHRNYGPDFKKKEQESQEKLGQ